MDDYTNTGATGYYAANPQEVKFDDWVRDRVRESGSKAEMALYVQGQEILNQLRWIRDQLIKPEKDQE